MSRQNFFQTFLFCFCILAGKTENRAVLLKLDPVAGFAGIPGYYSVTGSLEAMIFPGRMFTPISLVFRS